MSFTRYRQKDKPWNQLGEVDAMRWEPADLVKAGEMVGWLMAYRASFHHPSGRGGTTTLAVKTPDGEKTAEPGDWVYWPPITGAFFVCKAAAFDAYYEAGPAS